MANVETKADFAKRLGVNRSTVTRWGKAGRLVLAPNGKVKVMESEALLASTQGHRSDVAQRHAQARGNALPTQQSDALKATTDDEEDMQITEQQVGKDRAYYKAIALDIGNKQLKLEEALNRGIRLNKDQYHKQIANLAGLLKSGIERLIDNLAPQLANITNPQERKAKLNQEIKNLMEQIK